jgi:hypothetical protein
MSDIEYPNEELATLARDYETWADQRYGWMNAEGFTRDQSIKMLAAETPARFNKLLAWEAAHEEAVAYITAEVAAGRLIELEGDAVIEADRFDPAKHTRRALPA